VKTAQEPRIPKRLPCDVTVAGLRHTGLVLNVSPRGLFVQTSAEARPGTEVSIDLTPPNQKQPVEVRATVVWKRTVPRQMLAVARGGFGLRITEAPEHYYTYLSAVMRTAATPADPVSQSAKPVAAKQAATKPAPIERTAPTIDLPVPRKPMAAPITKQLKFRVRVSQCAGPRSRYIDISASSPTQAGRLALKTVGEGWQVLEVKLA